MMPAHRAPQSPPWLFSCAIAAAIAAVPVTASVAQVRVTHVLDAADGEDVFDADLEVRYELEMTSAQLVRERPCIAPGPNCPTKSGMTKSRELTFDRVAHRLVLSPRIGLYHDLELRFDLPIVLLLQDKYAFDAGVDASNSSVVGVQGGDPNGAGLFTVPFTGPKRAGFGDMSVGVRYSPYNQERDATEPTWVLGLTYTAPTGSIRKRGNGGVGQGVHALELYTTISRRVIPWLEPYFRFGSTLRIAGSGSLFEERGGPQTLAKPGNSLGLALGTEFVPWENTPDDARLEIDLGFSADYHFEGREYSELFEILAASPCAQDPQCTLSRYSRPLRAGDAAESSDGITDVAEYGIMRAWVGLHYQMWRHIQVGAQLTYTHKTDHIITNADPGRDVDGDGVVTATGSKGNEFSPTYIDAIDAPAGDPFTKDAPTRFRAQNSNAFGFMVQVMGRF